jgi:cell division protein FtsW
MAGKPKSHVPLTWRANPAGLGLVLTTFALLALGVVMVHSAVASVAEPGVWYARRDVRHTAFAAAAVLILVVGWRFDYRRLAGGGWLPIWPAILLGVALVCGALVYVPGLGHEVGHRYRWLRIGPEGYGIGFQPSELIKLSLLIVLAAWLSRRTADVRSFRRTFLPAVALVGLCVAVVVREDLGTAMLIGTTAVAALFLAGVPWYQLLSLVPPVAAGVYFYVVRCEYRWTRITAMLDPWCRENPSAYHARQSLLAIMTGGRFGKGLGQGMLKRGYLPEGPTDFIFSVFCEEWGLVGALLLVGLVLLWMWHARKAAVQAGAPFGRLLAGSLGFLIAFQATLHIAVDLVAAPPTGIGFPFISVGGTRLMAMAAAAALIVSVTAHREAADPARRLSEAADARVARAPSGAGAVST